MQPIALRENHSTFRIWSMPKIVIAAVDGVCTAGGILLALCCDIRTVSETAQISDLHMKNLSRLGETAMLTLTVGSAWAKELLITGAVIDGKEALRIGFANHVFPPDKLMEETKELARKIADRNPAAVRMCKAAVNFTIHETIEQGIRYNFVCRTALEPIVKTKEAARIFFEKREPTK